MVDGTPTSRAQRTARLGSLVAGQSARVAGGRVLDRARGDDAKERAQRKRTAAVVEQLVVQLGQMKGAAMKFGQVLSTVDLPGLEPEDSERIKVRLGELRDQAPKVGFDKLEKLMASEWGEPVGRVLADIDPEALAAASIGQVHRARTKEGVDVAVKIQYPGIAEAVESDLRNLRLLFPLLRKLAPGLDTKAVGDELRERISEELDYELEAQSQRRIARAWRDHPHAVVPGVLTDLSTRRVLVTEYVDGAPFSAVRGMDEAIRDRFAETLHRFYYDTASRLGLACGDPHPGNVLLARDGRVCFLDFGMLRHLPEGYLRGDADVFDALRRGDRRALRATLERLGYLPAPWEYDDELLFQHMRRAGSWTFDDPQPRRLDRDTGYEIMESLFALGPDWRTMVRSFNLPAEALLLRRMENILFGVCADLRAANDWRALGGELIAGDAPTTALGVEHAAWLATSGAPRGRV
jgi:predicted unusual protein kinase regulating ubiquinone biosynthesis (AarF/ABC1/UbiB family)